MRMMLIYSVAIALMIANLRDSVVLAEVVGRFVEPKPVYDDAVEVWLGSVSEDGLSLYFSSKSHGGVGDFDLFQVSRKTTNEPFADVVSLGDGINTRWSDRGGKISKDGYSMHFLSNRPDGFGDLDIYSASRTLLTDNFGNVENLGSGINSSSLEGGAHMSPDRLTMYFQSNRQGSLGDNRDLYQATRLSENHAFGDVMNLGTDVNSVYDDSAPVISSDQLTLFFNSPNRPTNNRFSTDIWVSSRDSLSDSFGPAVRIDDFSLGSNLTGPDIVFHPYISSSWPAHGSKLYYNRAIGLGDFDIYEATWIVGLEGDFDGRGVLDVPDLDILNNEISAETDNPFYDLNSDGMVDTEDLRIWVKDLKNTWFGDANLDGEFNSGDFITVFQEGGFETDNPATWEQGDWNADALFNTTDFIAAFQDGGFEQGPRIAMNSVPEPISALILVAGLFGIVIRLRTTAQ